MSRDAGWVPAAELRRGQLAALTDEYPLRTVWEARVIDSGPFVAIEWMDGDLTCARGDVFAPPIKPSSFSALAVSLREFAEALRPRGGRRV